jgi:hypothetical protein
VTDDPCICEPLHRPIKEPSQHDFACPLYGRPLTDDEQAQLYKFCQRDPAMYALVRRLAVYGLMKEPPMEAS